MSKSTDPATLGASPPPFFIVGCPRSGTTLLSVLMNRHSKIAVTPETAFYEETATWPWPCDPSTLRRLLSEWPRLSELRLDADAVIAACPEPSDAAEVFAAILSLYSGSFGKPICGEKTPQHLWHAGRILEDFPDSPVFCLVRDGRDVALSLAAMPWWNSDLRGAAHYWIDAVEQARRLNAAHPERFIVIRYEHLVTKPGETLGAIMARLDLPFETRQLVADEAEATPVILPRSYAWKGMASGPIDPGRIGFRRMKTGDEDGARLDAWLGPTLESLGYEASGSARSVTGSGIPASGRDAGVVPERARPLRSVHARAPRRSPRLTVSIMTRDSESRLGRLIDEVSGFADEIVVGVDVASTDRTFAIAADLADQVYRFDHPPGQLAAARMLIFRYASGDWILSLDDDESITDSFDELLPSMMADPVVTNYWFLRQWIVDRETSAYMRADPFFPDWQLRMFRNDPSLVWKPARAHSGYTVQGLSRPEPRVAIHHFERVLLSDDERADKIALYRDAGSAGVCERQYGAIDAGMPLGIAAPRRSVAPRPRGQMRAVIDPEINDPPIRRCAPWGGHILRLDMPTRLRPGQVFVYEAVARNTGLQSWSPNTWSMRGPLLYLSYHILTADGAPLVWDNLRHGVSHLVRPGECTTIIAEAKAPSAPGAYLFEWDFVCESETWFAQNGSLSHRVAVEVG